MKKISIIIPVYNGEKYIYRCINSIIESVNYCSDNIKKDIEIVIVNDGSKDKTGEIIKTFNKYAYIKIIEKENEGVSIARNIGMKEAIGEYVTFIDSDDYVDNKYFNILFKSIDNFPEFVIYNGFYTVKDNKINKIDLNLKQEEKIKYNKLIVDLVDQRLNNVCSKLFRLDLIKKENIKFKPNLKISEDYVFIMDYIKHINEIYVDRQLPYYYVYNENGSKKIKENYLNNIFYVYRYLSLTILKENDEEIYNIFLSRLLHQSMEFIGYYSKKEVIYNIDLDFLQDIKCKKFKSMKSKIERMLLLIDNKILNKIWYEICWGIK